MGTMARFGKVVIRVNGNDHLPPHFHVITPDAEALVTIDPIALHKGHLPAEVWAMVVAWATAHRAALVAEWTAWNPTLPIV